MKLKIFMSGQGLISSIKYEDISYITEKRHDLETVFHKGTWATLHSKLNADQSRFFDDVFPLNAYNQLDRCTIHNMNTGRKVVVVLSPCGHFDNCDLCITGKYIFKLSL